MRNTYATLVVIPGILCLAACGDGECINGVCSEICSRSPDSCGADAACTLYGGLFRDVGDGSSTGICTPSCDVVAQDCLSSADGCYYSFNAATGVCAVVPDAAATAEQNDPCYGPFGGACFLNGCARGYGAIVPDDPASQRPNFLCAFFCTPVNTTLNQGGAATAVGSQALPGQFDCNNDPGEARPGPGQNGSFECRFLNSFYADTGNVSPDVGFCVETATWGSCTEFDLEACEASPDPDNDPACASSTPGCVDRQSMP